MADSDDEDETHYVILTSEFNMIESNEATLAEHIKAGKIRATLKFDNFLFPDGFRCCQGMSITPYWIKNPGIDSKIMLRVFKDFVKAWGTETLNSHMPLTIIMHRDGPRVRFAPKLVEAGVIAQKACTAHNCDTCNKGKGGYSFKWVHTAWLRQYIRAAARRKDLAQPRWHIEFVDHQLGGIGW